MQCSFLILYPFKHDIASLKIKYFFLLFNELLDRAILTPFCPMSTIKTCWFSAYVIALPNHRSFDLEMRVAPVIGVLGTPQPQVGDAGAAREADRSVHDEELAVRPVVDTTDVVPPQWVVAFDLDSRVFHGLHGLRIHLLCPQLVQQDMHFNPGPSAADEDIGELPPDLALPVDERLKGNRMPCRTDGVEHGGKERVTVRQRGDPVAAQHRRGEQTAQRAEKLVVGDREQVLDLVCDLLLARGQDADDERQQV